MDMRRAPTKVSLLYGLALLLAGAMAGPAVADNKIAQAPSSPATATPAAPAIKGDGGTIRLVDNPYSTQSYARIVMQKFQLDKKYGFNLQIIPGGNTAASISAIQSGGTDFALFNWLDLARMRSAGVNVTGIGPFRRIPRSRTSAISRAGKSASTRAPPSTGSSRSPRRRSSTISTFRRRRSRRKAPRTCCVPCSSRASSTRHTSSTISRRI
jgi:hypothetical protein